MKVEADGLEFVRNSSACNDQLGIFHVEVMVRANDQILSAQRKSDQQNYVVDHISKVI